MTARLRQVKSGSIDEDRDKSEEAEQAEARKAMQGRADIHEAITIELSSDHLTTVSLLTCQGGAG